MEMENNKKNAEDHLTKQQIELASTTRQIKANKKQWLHAFKEFQKQLREKLKEVSKAIRCSIGSLANSVADDN
jgi:molecular chaperone GrpE (heat shock protein)